MSEVISMGVAGGRTFCKPWGKVFCASLLLAMSPTVEAAQTFLIDFSADVQSQGGGPGGKWNTFAAPANVNGGTILDSSNAASAVTLLLSGTATDNTQAASVVFDPNRAGVEGSPSWATSITDNTASGDFFYTSNSGTVAHTHTVTFGGLTAGDQVSLDLLASRDSSSAKGFYDYSVDGGTTWNGFRVLNHNGTLATHNNWSTQDTKSQVYLAREEGFQNHRYINIENQTLTGSTFMVRVTDADAVASTFSNINAMRLTVVPEPSAVVFGAVAVAGLLSRRRRNRQT